MDLQQHPFARKHIPAMKGQDFSGLVQSMKDHGFDPNYPIFTWPDDNGTPAVLVGWSRWKAAKQAKVEPLVVPYTGDDPLAFLIRSELPRRHLDAVDKLRIAEAMRPELEEEAKANSEKNLKNVGKSSSGSKEPVESKGPVSQQIADATGESEATAKRYKAIQEHGTEALQEAVHSKEVKITDAANIVKEPPEVQDAAVAAKLAGNAATVTAATILCRPCRVGTPKKGCKACKELRKLRKERNGQPEPTPREPGDDTESEAEAAAKPDIVDAEGRKVPAHAVIAFEQAEKMTAWGRKLDELIREMKEFTEGPGGRLIDYETARVPLKNGKMIVLQNRPTHVCPLCDGGESKKCQCCKGAGWTAAHVWKRIEADKAGAKS